MRIRCIIYCILIVEFCFSQEVNPTRLHADSWYIGNPAGNAFYDNPYFAIGHNSTFFKSEEYYNNSTLHVSLQGRKKIASFGFSFNNSNFLQQTNNDIALSYSVKVKISKLYLAFGLEEYINFTTFNYDELSIQDIDDPLIQTETFLRCNTGAGLNLFNESFDIGIGALRLVQIDNSDNLERTNPFFTGRLGYKQTMKNKHKLQLSFYGNYIVNQQFYGDLTFTYTLKNVFKTGIGINSQISPTVQCGYNIANMTGTQNSIWLTYSFDCGFSRELDYSNMQHEISLIIHLQEKLKPDKIRINGGSISPVDF